MADAKAQLSEKSKVGETSVDCDVDKNTTELCDISEIELLALGDKGASIYAIAASTRFGKNIEATLAKLPLQEDPKYADVKKYDAILEVVAPPRQLELEDKPLSVTARVSDLVGTCDDPAHISTTIINRQFDEADELPAHEKHINSSPKPKKIHPVAIDLDSPVAKPGLSEYFYLFDFLRNKQLVKDIEVNFASCGIRDDGKKPNGNFKGLIRLYRKDDYKLAINFSGLEIPTKLPSHSSTKHLVTGEQPKSEQAVLVSGDSVLRGELIGKNGEPTVLTETQSGALTSKETVYDGKTDRLTEYNQINDGLIQLTRNGRVLPVTEPINQVLKTVKTIEKSFAYFADLAKRAPTLGVKFIPSLSVLNGQTSLTWGLTNDDALSTNEYKWVRRYGKLGIELQLINASITGLGGFEIDTFLLNVTAGIQGSISLAMAINGELDLVDLSGFDRLNVIGGSGKSHSKDILLISGSLNFAVKLELIAVITVLGYGIEANTGVNTGFDGHARLVLPLNIRTEVQFKGLNVTGYIIIGKGKKRSFKKEVLKQRDMLKERYLL